MKKIFILLVIILLLTSCKLKIDNYEIEFNVRSDCDKEFNEYYSYQNNRIYLVCLNDIYLKNENTITLKDYFSKTWQTFDDALNHFISEMKEIKNNTYKKGNLIITKCDNGNVFFSKNDKTNYCDYLTILKSTIINKAIINNYDNYVGSYIDDEYLIVELENNNDSEQDYFRKNIMDSKHIKFVVGKKNNISKNADFLFNYRNMYDELLMALDLNNYGRYGYEVKDKTLEIKYSDIEGWGNLLIKEEMLKEKSIIILSLTNVDNILWINNTEKINININDLDIKNIKYYGSSSNLFTELMTKLGYMENPIDFKISELNKRGVNLEIINNSNKRYLYGAGFRLQEYIDGVWRDVNLNLVVNSIGYTLLPWTNVSRYINWSDKLPNGKYRIIKDFTEILDEYDNGFNFGKTYYIYYEFEI